ncbi:hypothetical protein [Mesorhizobium sp.]|uniref:hypothetical protein n=1 Tax=Mesorhizobium sp. TaxID=1871066 RepID=UPI00257A6580|nr:hypothetical protein [Mesorhizobium sp.]
MSGYFGNMGAVVLGPAATVELRPDRLVERTLERAIGEIDRRRAGVSTEDC